MSPPVALRPMLATLASSPPRGDGWAWELKWDGIRALVRIERGGLRIETRNGNDVSRRYPELHALADALDGHDAVLDGEIIAVDATGRPSFETLQRRMHVDDAGVIRRLAHEVPVMYMVFDVLWFDGQAVTDLPYRERRALLDSLTLSGPSWQTPPNEVGDGHVMLDVSAQYGLEGIVAKRVDSRYEPGRRSRNWMKYKLQRRQELVVGGWQPGEGGRTGSIGSLLVGYYDGDDLVYAGKVGSGLSGSVIDALRATFAGTTRPSNPFTRGTVPKGVQFVEPSVVVEVRFTEWTSAGNIRQPTFLGVRTDKDPRDVVREDAR